MLETLLKILSWDLPAPEIFVEDDGCLGLEWADGDAWVSIHPNGAVSWSALHGKHGTDMEELRAVLNEVTP